MKMDEEIYEVVKEILSKFNNGEEPSIVLADVQLLVSPTDEAKVVIGGTNLTKYIYKNLGIDDEELEELLKPVIEGLKDFQGIILEKMKKRSEEIKLELLKMVLTK
jgi:hypothetical protein